MTDIFYEEEQYLNLIRTILKEGTRENTRNGVTMSIFGHSMRFSLKDGALPLITTKKTAWKTCLKELLFFIRGETDNRILKEQGVYIWNANSTRKFLDDNGLSHYPEDCLGPVYGFQWRNWNGNYDISKSRGVVKDHDMGIHLYSEERPNLTFRVDMACPKVRSKRGVTGGEAPNEGVLSNINTHIKRCTEPLTEPLKDPLTEPLLEIPTKVERKGNGIDQLANIISSLKDPLLRTSRRLILSAWNPEQIGDMVLPPCHVIAQFNVKEDKYLSCCLFQRSGDVGLGVPFNIASYAFLTHILAKHCGLVAEDFVYFLGNAHIYEEHIETLQTQLKRIPYSFPTIEISQLRENIEDYQVEDVRFIKEYQHHDTLKMEMKA